MKQKRLLLFVMLVMIWSLLSSFVTSNLAEASLSAQITKLKLSMTAGPFYRLTWSVTQKEEVNGYLIYVNDIHVASRVEQYYEFKNLSHGIHKIYVRAINYDGDVSAKSKTILTPKSIHLYKDNVYINGKFVYLGKEINPLNIRNQWMVPYKPFLSALGMKLSESSKDQTIIATMKDKNITMQFKKDKKSIQISSSNRKEISSFKVSPFLLLDRIWIPLDFFALEFGYKVKVTPKLTAP